MQPVAWPGGVRRGRGGAGGQTVAEENDCERPTLRAVSGKGSHRNATVLRCTMRSHLFFGRWRRAYFRCEGCRPMNSSANRNRRRGGAVQDLAELPRILAEAPASWSAAALCRFRPTAGLLTNSIDGRGD